MGLLVVGVDGSLQSRRAMRWACEHAVRDAHTVEAVMAVHEPSLDTDALVAAKASAEQTLAEVAQEATEGLHPSPVVAWKVTAKNPALALIDAAEDAELIVLGAHGLSSIRRTDLGSVTLACIRMGTTPVVVLPLESPIPPEDRAPAPAG
jgi:nucleotide-binding universal stress UspA family protein